MSELMHNVRAYTFWSLPFYISAYTTLNELLAVFSYNKSDTLLKHARYRPIHHRSQCLRCENGPK